MSGVGLGLAWAGGGVRFSLGWRGGAGSTITTLDKLRLRLEGGRGGSGITTLDIRIWLRLERVEWTQLSPH